MSAHPILLSRAQVLERLGGRSVSWLYAEMAAGRVPRPIRLGLSPVVWVESEIADYIARHIAECRVPPYVKPRKRPAVAQVA
jgi:predicted DNA-binding transcriptional regulator AlpA